MAESDISILKTIEKQQMKDAYEQTKSNNRLNGAEKQAINDIYLKSATIIQYTIKGRFMSR